MNIFTWTYSGSYPCGIQLHADNMKWAINAQPKVLTHKDNLKNTSYPVIESKAESLKFKNRGKFYDFWATFPQDVLVNLKQIPEYFLFSELDIFFIKKPNLSLLDGKSIITYLPKSWHYFCVLENGEKVYPRIWEGAMLVPASVVYKALACGVSFSQKGHTYWKDKKGVSLMTYKGKITETMSDFTLFCYEHQIPVIEEVCAIHVRGPERIHADLPQLYQDVTNDLIKKYQGYVDIELFNALCLYYICGNDQPVESWDWNLQKTPVLPWLLELNQYAEQWMEQGHLTRLRKLISLIQKSNP